MSAPLMRRVAVVTLALAGLSFGEIMLSFRPGLMGLNGAQLGLGTEYTKITTGIDYAFVQSNTKVESTYGHREYDDIEPSSYEYTFSAHLLMPALGVKQYFGRNSICPYLSGGIFYVFPIVNIEIKDDDEYGHGDDDYYEELSEDIEESISTFGTNVAFGAEYFFADRFSIGGEFGVNLFMNSIISEDDDSDEDYIDEFESKAFTLVGLTRTSIVLNFFF